MESAHVDGPRRWRPSPCSPARRARGRRSRRSPGPLPVTATSHPFGAADHQLGRGPRRGRLRRGGVPGQRHGEVYSWPAPGPAVVRTAGGAVHNADAGPPAGASARSYSGNAVVEMLNPSNRFDLNIGWALDARAAHAQRRHVGRHHGQADRRRGPQDVRPDRATGRCHSPTRSRSTTRATARASTPSTRRRARGTEDGLVWDINSQVGAWLKSARRVEPAANGTGRRPRPVGAYGFG